jgi:hypothetical protein
LLAVVVIASFIISLLPVLEKDQESESTDQSDSKNTFSNKTLPNIGEPKEIDLSNFAPFYYWSSAGNDQLMLTKYAKDNSEIKYESLIKKDTGLNTQDPGIQFISVNSKSDKVMLSFNKISDGINTSILKIFDTVTEEMQDFENESTINIAGTHVFFNNPWSPSGTHFYYLYSSDYEEDHNIWVIDVKDGDRKKLLNGYAINVLGWVDDYTLAYYEYPNPEQKELIIYSVDVRSGVRNSIGSCNKIWFYKCLKADYTALEDGLLFLENPNTTRIYKYDFQEGSGILINDILYEEQFTSAKIKGFSPNKNIMYFYIFESHTNIQPEKGGLYEYNIVGDYFRYIAKKDLKPILWDKISQQTVLFKGKGEREYYIHPVDSFDINTAKIPEKIIEFKY